MSLKEEILKELKNSQEWTHSGDIEQLSFSLGYKAANGGRRCRELFNSGLIEREIRNDSVWYRYKGEESKFVKEMREIRERAMAEREINYTAKLF
jgi:hypothetical protein